MENESEKMGNEFNQDDALERELAETFRSDSPENLLRKNLSRIAGKFDSPDGLENPSGDSLVGQRGSGKFWWAAAVLILLAGAVFFFNNFDEKQPSSPTNPPLELEKQQPAEPNQIEPNPSEPAKTQKEKDPKTQKPEPVAAAFRPLPQLEKEIGGQVRGGDLKLKIVEPASAAIFRRQSGQVDFKLSGKAENWRSDSKSKFDALIFSNDRTAWEAFRPLHRHRILVDAASGQFIWEEKLPLGEGVFYLLIENSESGEWTFVDKFFVK